MSRAAQGWTVLLVAATALYLLLVNALGYGIVDDAYISLRYARNLVQGEGLVFNVGERVEGYTNPLWTWLLALGLWAGVKGPALAVGLGLLAVAATLVAATLLHARHLAPPASPDPAHVAAAGGRAISTPLALAVSTPFLCYGASGMETPLFTLFLVGSVGAFLAGLQTGRGFVRCGLLLAAANLVRPEASFLFLFDAAWLLLVVLRKSRPLAQLVRLAVPYAVVFGGFLVWRRLYYGDWVPNTYHAKVGTPGALLLGAGLTYAGHFALVSVLVLLLPVALFSRRLRRAGFGYVAGVVLVFLGVIALEGGDHFALYRFGVPLLPFVAILYREVPEHLWAARGRGALAPWAGTLLALALSGASSVWMAKSVRMHGMTEQYRAELEVRLAQSWEGFGNWLRENSAPEDAVALVPIGAIGYASERPVVDMLGLTDRHIAGLPVRTGAEYIGHEKFDNAYVLGKRPRFVLASHLVVFGRPPDEEAYASMAFFPVHQELVELPELRRDYVYRVVRDAPGRFYAFYELRD